MREDAHVQIPSGQELHASAVAVPALSRVIALAPDVGGEVYLVGGAVRDLILGRDPVDVDLAVDGEPLALAAALGTPDGGETRFGTVSVIGAGTRYDIARTRSERYAYPGALPAVEPAGIAADLARRDFTVNAIALGLTGPRAGELLAADGALADLGSRRLAALHERSFEDDPTRLLRLARYAARLGFEIAPRTRALAERAVAGGALDTVSGTRIGNELRLLASEPDPLPGLQLAADLGLPWYLDADLTARALAALPADGRPDLLILACVFASPDGDRTRERVTRELDHLGFAAAERDLIAEAATQARGLARRLDNAGSRAEIGREVGAAAVETVALASAWGATAQAQAWLRELRHLNLDITGEDLIRNGVPEGPRIGRALAAARDALLDGEAPDRGGQLRVALKAVE